MDRRGATAVELGAVAPILFGLLLGGYEVGRYFFVSESLQYFVGEVARAAIINPDVNPVTQRAALLQKAPILEDSKLTTFNVNITRASAPTPTTVTVTASYDHFVRYNKVRTAWSNLFRPITSTITLSFVAP
jgi:Flp pilus assembly protein TadG